MQIHWKKNEKKIDWIIKINVIQININIYNVKH